MKCASILFAILLVQEPPASVPTVQQQNDAFEAKILKQIAGRENQPAEEVFDNVELLRGIPASRLLRIMNMGYSRALGVACTHCHLEDNFASDAKHAKRAAREMALMHRAINEQLAKMENLDTVPAKRAINCNTCHRGKVSPLAP